MVPFCGLVGKLKRIEERTSDVLKHGSGNRALIRELKPRELQELYSWLDENCPQPVDNRIQSDLLAGRLDKAIVRALDDENNDRVRPL